LGLLQEDWRRSLGHEQGDIGGRIAAARNGDPSAAARLLEGYRNYLRFLARDGLGDPLHVKVDASDLAQEVLIRAAGGFREFRGDTEAELLAWLRAILARRIVDMARRYRVSLQKERSLEAALEQSSRAFASLLTASATSPSANARRAEQSRIMADALAQLSPDHQEVIRLRSVRELPWDEVARTMGRSNDAVRQLWVRALKALRPRLEERLR